MPWRVSVAQVGVERLAVNLVDRGFVTPLATEVGQLKLQFRADAEVGQGEPQLRIDGLGLQLADVGVKSGDKKPAWLHLASIELADGRFGLAGRELTLGSVVLGGGRVDAVRDAQGRVSLLEALDATPARRPRRHRRRRQQRRASTSGTTASARSRPRTSS